MIQFLKELWSFIKYRKKFWLIPLLVSLLIFSIIVVGTQGTAVAPFIYAIF